VSKIPRNLHRNDDQVGSSNDLLIHARKRAGGRGHWYGGYHGHVRVNRYTEDYVRASGRVTSRTMFDAQAASLHEG